MSRELQLRIMSAVVLAAIVLGPPGCGMVFALVAAAISLLIFYEWTSITGHKSFRVG